VKWSVRNADDVIVFDLKGALEGAHDAYQIKETVKEKIQEGHRKFLINLDQVDFINSTGIGIIAHVFHAISSSGGKMKISNANEKVSRVMTVTKLLEVFDAYPNEADALTSFRGQPV
jgi:anti-sigma B factor antagonist